jgi:hypothetical protein
MSKEENTPYSFKGDNAKLVGSIKSLLALDSQGALVPHGVGGLARQLLESAAERLGAEEQPAAEVIEHYGFVDGVIRFKTFNMEQLPIGTLLYASPTMPASVAPEPDIEAAAKKLAACMDYPWEHMPEQGRASMREHAKAIVSAALSASADPTNKEAP